MSPCPSSGSQVCRAAGVSLEAEPVTAASGVDMVAAWAALTTSFGSSNVIEGIGSPLRKCGLDLLSRSQMSSKIRCEVVVIALPRKPTAVDVRVARDASARSLRSGSSMTTRELGRRALTLARG
jgi:hypothetical protein